MFKDLNKYHWMLKPIIEYSSVERLLEVLEDEIIKPAEAKFIELLAGRTEEIRRKKV